ncbi:hypothetical protein AALB16_16560, partial [Lachnospiraceae bacterium 62-35]
MIKFCKKCQEENAENCPSGYYFGWKDSVTQCPNCGGQMIDIDFPARDLATIEEISEDTAFIESMIQLHDTNPIEYQLKMSQFRTQVEQQKNITQTNSNTIKCPTCNSTKVKRISGTAKAAGAAAFGIFSKTARSQFKCEN